jgi:hypothetical protein
MSHKWYGLEYYTTKYSKDKKIFFFLLTSIKNINILICIGGKKCHKVEERCQVFQESIIIHWIRKED